MTGALEKLGAAVLAALEEASVADVLGVITGTFVGLTVEVVRRQGHDVNKEIEVDGGPNRDITIHAPKAPQPVTWEHKLQKLIRCAAGQHGECCHEQCPQNRDGEPMRSGRHCPLDIQKED